MKRFSTLGSLSFLNPNTFEAGRKQDCRFPSCVCWRDYFLAARQPGSGPRYVSRLDNSAVDACLSSGDNSSTLIPSRRLS